MDRRGSILLASEQPSPRTDPRDLNPPTLRRAEWHPGLKVKACVCWRLGTSSLHLCSHQTVPHSWAEVRVGPGVMGPGTRGGHYCHLLMME